MSLSAATFTFLKDLAKHNDREWFAEHKHRYTTAHEDVIALADTVLDKLSFHDEIETPTGKKAVMRIYRDVRFSKNKDPYKTNFGMSFKRAGALRRGGLYVHIQPGNCFVGGGFWGPERDDLKRLRDEIARDAAPLRAIIEDADFKRLFGELEGEQLKTAPKGFDKAHPDIDLLRYKQFLLSKNFTDKEAKSKDFPAQIDDCFRGMRPFLDWASETLTTDANGVPLY